MHQRQLMNVTTFSRPRGNQLHFRSQSCSTPLHLVSPRTLLLLRLLTAFKATAAAAAAAAAVDHVAVAAAAAAAAVGHVQSLLPRFALVLA